MPRSIPATKRLQFSKDRRIILVPYIRRPCLLVQWMPYIISHNTKNAPCR